MSADARPRLRPVETIVVPDPEHGRVLVLRDTQGVTSANACIPPALFPIVSRFTGQLTCTEIARAASREVGQEVPISLVLRLAKELEEALFLDGPLYQAALEKVRADFRSAKVRPASHAGGAYSASPTELITYIDERCLAQAVTTAPVEPSTGDTTLTGLIAPHIDPWRGATGYGHAYATLRSQIAPEADTFIVFGTSHAPMHEPFALCRKGFDTPLGTMEADLDAIDRIAAKCPYDPYTDELNHQREHSIEFQAVFLKHVLGDRPARIIPILAGLGEQQAHGTDPAKDTRAQALLDAVRELVSERGRRVVLVAGADLAHVGPRFGDRQPFDATQRQALEKKDLRSLALATAGDSAGFWRHVLNDIDARRVCGLAPIYAMLETQKPGSKGLVMHYEQTIDAEEGSIVSHAAVAFHG